MSTRTPTTTATLAALAAAPALCVAQGIRTGLFAADPAGAQIVEFVFGAPVGTRVFSSDPLFVAPVAMCWDPVPHDNLLVADRGAHAVFRISSGGGSVLGVVVPPGAGGLVAPVDLARDPNRAYEILVLSGEDGSVRRYDASSGLFLGVAVAGRGRASAMQVYNSFWPSGRTLVTIAYPDAGEILTFDAQTGELVEVLARGIESPRALGRWGWILVVEDRADPQLPDRVLRLDGPGQPPRLLAELPLGEVARDVLCCGMGRMQVSTGGSVLVFGRSGGWMFGRFDVAPGHSATGLFAVSTCYADCDTSTGIGVLDIFDFLCFQNVFERGWPYACDCDTATGAGVCDVFDFLCFQNFYALGCP